MSEPYILFRINNIQYAVPSSQVQQLEMIEAITPVPNAPAFVEGVVFMRGRVVPVISLRSRFGLEKIPYDITARLIVIDLDGRTIGLTVDSAREFISIDTSHILPPPESLVGPRLEYLRGVVSLQDRLILVVDLHKLLDPIEAQALSEPISPAS